MRAFFEKKKRCKKKTTHSNSDGDSAIGSKKSNSPSLVCELCGEIYRTHGSLSVHKQMHGNTVIMNISLFAYVTFFIT